MIRQPAFRRYLVVIISGLIAFGTVMSLSGCGATHLGPRPSVGQAISSSVQAVETTQHPAVHYQGNINLSVTPTATASEHPAGHAINLAFNGGLSSDALTANLTASYAQKNYLFTLLIGPHATFLNVLNTWYGGTGTSDGLDADGPGTGINPTTLSRDLALIRTQAATVLDAHVSVGPNLGGATWQIAGTCNPTGIEQLALVANKQLSSGEKQTLTQLCPALHFSYDVGAQDHLPRRLTMTITITQQILKSLEPTLLTVDQAATKQLNTILASVKSVQISFGLTLDQWGQPVTFQPPAHYQSFQQLLGKFSQLEPQLSGTTLTSSVISLTRP